MPAEYFQELATVSRTPLFTLSSIYPLSDLRNVVTGTPTLTNGEYVLESGDKIESAEFGRYIPGFALEAGIGVRVSTAPTGSQVLRWGVYDDNDGFFFEQDADGVYTVVRRAGTDTRTVQASWNVDKADGTGTDGRPGARAPSLTLDTSAGNIFQIIYYWYAFGPAQWSIQQKQFFGPLSPERMVDVHRYAPSGATSVQNPNLPLTVENTGAGDGVLQLGGRQLSVIGRYMPQKRSFSRRGSATSVGTSWTPIVALRRKNNDDASRIKIRLNALETIVTADMDVGVVANPTITFGTAVDPDLDGGTESATEFSVNPSGFTLGDGEPIVVRTVDASGSGNNASGAEDLVGLDIPVSRLRPFVVVARTLSGTGDIEARATVTEEW